MNTPREETTARLNYVEFSVPATGKTKAFYQEAFGWTLVDFGPTYAATVTGDTDIGLQADNPGGPKPPLPVIQVGDLEASLARALAAGAVLVTPIFSFPGGRRFHVRDPAGNEIAVTQPDAEGQIT
jgi:predicted enzyme related to lactoylglutathione lyase